MRIPAALLTAILVSSWVSPAEPPAPAPLSLSAASDQDSYAPGAHVSIRLTVTNSGDRPLLLFQPDSVNRAWPTWHVEGSILTPDGRECALEPEVRYSALGVPLRRHFRSLPPGGSVVIPLAFSASQSREGAWNALWPLSSKEARQPAESLRRKYGFAGEVAFVGSGRQEYLSLQDPADLLRAHGRYALRFVYQNTARGFLERESGKTQHVPMPSAWTGTLEATLQLDVR